MAPFGHAAVAASCLLLGEERTWLGRAGRSEFDPSRTLFGCTVTVSQRGPLTKPRLAKRVDW
jgi:hypothetical protein